MKKILIILCALSVVFVSACDNRSNTQNDTTTLADYKSSTTETIKNEFTSSDITSNTVATENLSTKDEQANQSASTPTPSNEDVNYVPPYILAESLADLRQIKLATETMSEAEFTEYMDKNFSTEVVNGMSTLENTKRFLSDFEKTYVVFIDEWVEDNVMAYYIEAGDVSYKISVDDECWMSCRFYIKPEKMFEYKDGDIVKHLTTYEVNGITFELYENTADETEGLYGNIKFNEICIPFFTNIKISTEQFENILPRIGIIQIGDLLKE